MGYLEPNVILSLTKGQGEEQAERSREAIQGKFRARAVRLCFQRRVAVSLTWHRFIVEDEKYNYMSGRHPAAAQLLVDKLVALSKGSDV